MTGSSTVEHLESGGDHGSGDFHALVSALRELIGEAAVTTEPAVVAAASTDWTPLAVKARAVESATSTAPRVLVTPASEDDVAQVLRWATANGVGVQVVGGRSSVVAGVSGTQAVVLLSTEGLREIVDLEPTDAVVTVGAGVNGGQLEDYLSARGFILPHQPQSLRLSTVGGWVATRATGVFSNGYGGIEDLVTFIRAVLPDGSVVHVEGAPRRSVGPDLRHLFLGAEGTHGVVTQVGLSVRRAPAERRLASFALPSLAAGIDVIRELSQSTHGPELLRLYDAAETRRYAKVELPSEHCLLMLGWDGEPDVNEARNAWAGRLVTRHGGQELAGSSAESWYATRQVVDWLTDEASTEGRIIDTLEFSASWSRLAEAHARLTGLASEVVASVEAHFSHSYPTGACMYVVVRGSVADDAEALATYRELWRRLTEEAVASGVAISHHHGVGRLRAPWLSAARSGDLALLESVRKAIDPQKIVNQDLFAAAAALGSATAPATEVNA